MSRRRNVVTFVRIARMQIVAFVVDESGLCVYVCLCMYETRTNPPWRYVMRGASEWEDARLVLFGTRKSCLDSAKIIKCKPRVLARPKSDGILM